LEKTVVVRILKIWSTTNTFTFSGSSRIITVFTSLLFHWPCLGGSV